MGKRNKRVSLTQKRALPEFIGTSVAQEVRSRVKVPQEEKQKRTGFGT